MKRNFVFLGIFLILVCVGILSVLSSHRKENAIQNFEDCVASGRPVMESYPEQCRTKDGRNFVKDIGNSLEKTDLIVLDSPRPGEKVRAPLTITGKARGYWFFEASFPVVLLDEKSNEIAVGAAQAKGDWMTTEFVPFSVTLSFTSRPVGKGTLILKKDNPSGDPAREDSLHIPVSF